eukprot:3394883-Prymnesium_polylepis.1
MMRCVAVAGATRTLRCHDWHEVVAVRRPRSAPTRPHLCRDAGSSVGASSWGQPVPHPDTPEHRSSGSVGVHGGVSGYSHSGDTVHAAICWNPTGLYMPQNVGTPRIRMLSGY